MPLYPGPSLISYVEITAGVTSPVVAEASAAVVITAPDLTPDGFTAYYIDFYTPSLTCGATGGSVTIMDLFDNGSSLGQCGVSLGASHQESFFIRRRLVPTAVVHSYSWRTHSGVSAGTVQAGAGGAGVYPPAFMAITRVV